MNIGDKWKGWTVESFIGEGTYGKVYRIIRNEFNHTYESALKVISIPQSSSEIATIRNEGMDDDSITTYFKGMVEDIVSEFAIMSELKGNSNIVSYEDHSYEKREDSFGWDIYIRMEMLTSLFSYLKGNDFTINDAVKLGIDMCKALEICQRYNIIHRDVKPENIFVSKLGDFKLGDFGIARQLENATASMSKKGTYSYMAPEVYKGESYNSTVDTYSLGIVLYRILNNNRLPFLSEYPNAISFSDRQKSIVRRLSGEKMPAPCFAKGRLAEIVLKACAYDPKDRYESPRDMRKALESILLNKGGEIIINPRIIDNDSEESSRTLPWNYTLSGDETTLPNTNHPEKEPPDPEPPDSEPPDPEPPKQKKRKRIIVAIVAAVMVAIIGAGIFKYYHHPVPNVVGMDAVDAAAAISRAGLTYSNSKEFSDTVERGQVVSQTNQGDSVKKGTKIQLTVSAGAPVSVPDLVGLSENDAKETVEKAGLVMTVEGEALTDNIPKGCISTQNPGAGSELEVESEIKVIVSKGIIQVEVPDVIGESADEAKKKLKKAGLKSGDITYEYSSKEEGLVIAQSAEAGKKIDKHSAIDLVVSSGAAPVQTPKKSSGSKKSSSSKKRSSRKKAKKEAEWS